MAERDPNSVSISSRVGVAEKDSAIDTRSKSKLACRSWYCAESTRRIEASIPIAFMFSTHGEKMRTKESSSASISTESRSPFALASIAPTFFHPASPSNLVAAPSSLRSRPEPFDTGCVTASPKASGGRIERSGSSSASSAGEGAPSAL